MLNGETRFARFLSADVSGIVTRLISKLDRILTYEVSDLDTAIWGVAFGNNLVQSRTGLRSKSLENCFPDFGEILTRIPSYEFYIILRIVLDPLASSFISLRSPSFSTFGSQ
jgi:hypothetical protein